MTSTLMFMFGRRIDTNDARGREFCRLASVLKRGTGNILADRESMPSTATDYEGSLLWTLEEIGRLISQSGNASETLHNIVQLIQQRFGTDVCSVYLLEPNRTNLVLAATIGLRPESVGRVRMRLSEGLVGLVA